VLADDFRRDEDVVGRLGEIAAGLAQEAEALAGNLDDALGIDGRWRRASGYGGSRRLGGLLGLTALMAIGVAAVLEGLLVAVATVIAATAVVTIAEAAGLVITAAGFIPLLGVVLRARGVLAEAIFTTKGLLLARCFVLTWALLLSDRLGLLNGWLDWRRRGGNRFRLAAACFRRSGGCFGGLRWHDLLEKIDGLFDGSGFGNGFFANGSLALGRLGDGVGSEDFRSGFRFSLGLAGAANRRSSRGRGFGAGFGNFCFGVSHGKRGQCRGHMGGNGAEDERLAEGISATTTVIFGW
jgi:hypothetical protein